MSVLSTGFSNYSSTEAKNKGRKKTTLWKFFQRRRKELPQSSPENLASVLTGPNCVTCPFLDQLLARDIGLPLFPLGLPLELKHMGSIGEGLTPKQNWASVRMAKASNRHCLATATSLQPYTLSLQSHGIRAGEGQAGSQINISRDVHFSFCSLVLIIPLTTTVFSWTPSPPPWHALLGLPHPAIGVSLSLRVLSPAFTIPHAAPRKNACFLGWWSFKWFSHNTGAQESLVRLSLILFAKVVSGKIETGPYHWNQIMVVVFFFNL